LIIIATVLYYCKKDIRPLACSIKVVVVDSVTQQALKDVRVSWSDKTGRTDENGIFIIEEIAPGRHSISIEKEKINPKTVQINLPLGCDTTLTIPAKSLIGKLYGEVKDSITLQPLVGVSISLSAPYNVSKTTDSKGIFTFNALEGSCVLTAKMPKYTLQKKTVTIKGSETQNLNLLMNSIVGKIQGVVKDSVTNETLSEILVTLLPLNDLQPTNEDGKFEFTDLVPGNYELTVKATKYVTYSQTIVIKAGDTKKAEIKLQSNIGKLTGIIKDTLINAPLKDVTITLSPGNRSVKTTEDGSYEFAEVEAGNYTLFIQKDRYLTVLLKNISVEAYKTGTTSLSLIPFGALMGKVTDDRGNPLSEVDLVIEGNDLRTTDKDGNYAGWKLRTHGNYLIKANKQGYQTTTKAINFTSSDDYFVLDFILKPKIIVTDFEGNTYKTITIGNQVWLAENLRSTKYAVGTSIDSVWAFNNDEANAAIYGRLYNWTAAMKLPPEYLNKKITVKYPHQGVCPTGWHVPSYVEWQTLQDYCGGENIAGKKLKTIGNIEDGTGLWDKDTAEPLGDEGTNASGFSAVPGGIRGSDGTYAYLGDGAHFWSSSPSGNEYAWSRYLWSYGSWLSRDYGYRTYGFSVRCVQN